MANLGTLTLDIVAKIGGFTAGLGSAEREAQKRAKAIEKAFDSAAIGVGVAFGVMAAAGIAAFAGIKRGIDEAAKFQDLAEEIGASAEDLASFAVAAATAGVSIESVAGASVKLTKSLVGVDDESKAAGAAIEALGLNVAEFKQLDPAAQYEAIGKALAGYADGAGKTAIAVALFGKAGAEQLKVFKALEEQGGRSNILTKEQIKLADDYADKQAKLRAELGLYASALATETLPALNAFTGAMTDSIKELLNLGKGASDLGANQGVRDFADNAAVFFANVIDLAGKVVTAFQYVGETVGATAAIVAAANRDSFEATKSAFSFDPKGLLDTAKRQVGQIGSIFNDAREQGKKYTTETISLADKVNKRIDDRKTNDALARQENRGFDPRPKVNFQGAVTPPKTGGRKAGGGAVDDPTKKLLENELANFKAMGDQAKEQLADRNKILDLYNQQGLLSVRDYYAGLKNATDDATAAQAKSFDDQIASLEKFKAAAKKDTEVADTQGKINKLTEEKAKLYRQAGIEAIAMGIKEEQAAKAVREAFNEVNAKVLEFQGNLRAAAEIRFDASNEKLIAQATAEHNDAVVQQITLLKQYTLAQADLNKAQQQFSLAQGDLQIAEERITIARERGTMGEIESLRASGVARQQAVALMEKHLAALLAINDAARSPEQVQAIERLKVQLEGLKATIDPLADKFNTMFGDAAGSAFSDFINGTKTAKEAFKSFTDSIFKQLTDLIVKDLFKQLFSSSGGGTGFNVGKMLSDFFGSASGGGMFGAAKGATAQPAAAAGGEDVLGAFISKLGTGDVAATSAAASSTAMATAATAAATAISAMAAAASAAATALAAAAATSSSSSLGSLASSLAGANAVGGSGGDALGALIKLQGWSSGGFTGMGAANDPAGIVHKGEYVLDSNTTKRLGVSYLNGLNNGGSTGGTSVVINQQFAAGTSRETTNQAALAASRVISRSQRNA